MKFKGFWNDGNGVSDRDFEKIILGVLFSVVVLAIVAKFLTKNITNMDMIYLATAIGSLFVVRKGISYFKPERYYEAGQGEVVETEEPVEMEEQL